MTVRERAPNGRPISWSHLPVEDVTDHRDGRTAARDRRAGVVIAGGLVLLAGVWLVLAPFVLRYRAGDPIWNDVACGAALLMLSLVQIAALRRSAPLGWLCALIGLWLIASALWVNATSAAATNDVVVGFAVAVFALAGLASADSAAPERSSARSRGRR